MVSDKEAGLYDDNVDDVAAEHEDDPVVASVVIPDLGPAAWARPPGHPGGKPDATHITPAGVCFVDLSLVHDPALLPQQLATSLDLGYARRLAARRFR